MKKFFLSTVVCVSLVTGIFIGQAMANQPHMQSALQHLEKAQQELQLAEHDKGGHRANAIKMLGPVIGEVRAGIASGRGR